jgi:RNA polymerase sigma-70 factor (ECF subfamily)
MPVQSSYTAGPPGVPGNLGQGHGVVKVKTSVEGRPLDDDGELIKSARGGDLTAYDRLVEQYLEVALRLAHVMCGANEASDVTQEAFVKAWRGLDRFRDDAPFRPWLLRIVANEARNARRSAGRRAGLAVRAVEDRPSMDAAPSVEEAVLLGERRRLVLTTVESLDDRDRDVISCRYLAGLSEAETARVLGCRVGTVKSRCSRALARLRTLLDDARLTCDRGSRDG